MEESSFALLGRKIIELSEIIKNKYNRHLVFMEAWRFSVLPEGEEHDLRIVCFAMELWGRIRQQLYVSIGNLSPENIVEEMLRNADRWSRVANYVRVLFIAKKIEVDRWRSRMAGGSLN